VTVSRVVQQLIKTIAKADADVSQENETWWIARKDCEMLVTALVLPRSSNLVRICEWPLADDSRSDRWWLEERRLHHRRVWPIAQVEDRLVR
jgi:hypothetical protein